MNLGEGNVPPETDCRSSSIPSAYAGDWNRLNGIWAEPHRPFRGLLHVPSYVRYLCEIGEQNGWSLGEQNASSDVRRNDIFGGDSRPFSEKSICRLEKRYEKYNKINKHNWESLDLKLKSDCLNAKFWEQKIKTLERTKKPIVEHKSNEPLSSKSRYLRWKLVFNLSKFCWCFR